MELRIDDYGVNWCLWVGSSMLNVGIKMSHQNIFFVIISLRNVLANVSLSTSLITFPMLRDW